MADLQSLDNFIAIVVGLSTIAVCLYYLFRCLCKHTYYRYGNFELRFLDHLPPDHIEIPMGVLHKLSLGEYELCCSIRSKHLAKFKFINFRFLNSDNTTAPQDKVEVKTLGGWRDNDVNPKHLDSNGGLDAGYDEIKTLAPKEIIYFRVGIHAKGPWSGKLSFRSKDDNGFRMYARHDVRIE